MTDSSTVKDGIYQSQLADIPVISINLDTNRRGNRKMNHLKLSEVKA
ncbi:hypothetical protein [Lentibacillus cibarius]|nr:hypothetical protein [Lentibacillus cibarius]